MQSWGRIFLVISILTAPEPSKEDAAKKDLERVQGTWKVVTLEALGIPAPVEIVATMKFVFKDDRLTCAPGEPGNTNYTFKLDPTTKPASFDMIHADGENKGKTQKGIYSLDGNSLKICFGTQRPKEFTAAAKSGQAMYVLKREKP